jgi:hypothetical protein
VREVVPDGPDHELCLGQALGQHPLLVRADRARVERQVGRSVPTELREPLVAPPDHLVERTLEQIRLIAEDQFARPALVQELPRRRGEEVDPPACSELLPRLLEASAGERLDLARERLEPDRGLDAYDT